MVFFLANAMMQQRQLPWSIIMPTPVAPFHRKTSPTAAMSSRRYSDAGFWGLRLALLLVSCAHWVARRQQCSLHHSCRATACVLRLGWPDNRSRPVRQSLWRCRAVQGRDGGWGKRIKADRRQPQPSGNHRSTDRLFSLLFGRTVVAQFRRNYSTNGS